MRTESRRALATLASAQWRFGGIELGVQANVGNRIDAALYPRLQRGFGNAEELCGLRVCPRSAPADWSNRFPRPNVSLEFAAFLSSTHRPDPQRKNSAE